MARRRSIWRTLLSEVIMAVRSSMNINGDAMPSFPLGGSCRIVDVTENWTDLLGPSKVDQVLLRVPEGSKRVLVLTSADALSGTLATIDQSNAAWILDPGVWEFCVDRDSKGPRFFLAIDPADGSDDAVTAAVRVLEAASA